MTTEKWVGPYRLGEVLGAGGMGVVYRAWDERLKRQVAIKHVRPDLPDKARRQERLRREARAVAQLSHPAIVQIHDVVEAEDGDWIVMEYVEGQTLAQRLRQGPVPLNRALQMAQEIAEGLAEAHSRGFLHRDLKTANVMVMPSGRARILDFGLVKPYWPQRADDDGDFDTSSLAFLGTPRAMSPEQVASRSLDPRSDLFSFGTLLYELTTGVSPFRGDSPGETLNRICTHQPAPASEHNPEIPTALSELIDRLLEKDRKARPANAQQVADTIADISQSLSPSSSSIADLEPFAEMTTIEERRAPSSVRAEQASRPSRGYPHRFMVGVLLLALLAAGFFRWREGQREPLYVTVSRPEISTRQEAQELDLLVTGIHTALLQGLVELRHIAVLQPNRGEELTESPLDLAHSMAAGEVLTSRLDCENTICIVTLQRIQASDGSLRWVKSFEVPTDDFSLLATAAITHVQRGYPEYKVRSGAPRLEVRPEDYEQFLRLNQIYQNRQEAGALDRLLAQLESVRQSSPRFLEAYLLEARLAHLHFFYSHQPQHLERTLDLLYRARDLAPDDPRSLIELFKVLLVTQERLEEAEQIFQDLEALIPADVRLLHLQALLLERRGEKLQALERMRTATQRHPSSHFLIELANLEIRLGEIEAARQDLQELLKRFPKHFKGASRLARLELSSGSARRASELYAGLVEIRPGFAELSNLGTAQMLLGEYQAAAVSFRRALQKVPNSPTTLLSLADAELLQGDRDEANVLYRQMLTQLEEDPAASFWQSLTIKAQALAHLGQAGDAVTAIQQALRQAPEHPQAMYEAALVYALVGDQASAQVYARKALEGGVERRWFSFPWFRALREEPAFAALTREDSQQS